MPARTVLVTGATGYVGSRLVPRLLDDGWTVHAAFTDVSKADDIWWGQRVTPVELDVTDQQQVREAVKGVDALVYLVHGMAGDDFVEQDRKAATYVAEAIDEHGVDRVVYLSGIVPSVPEEELSDHITSRLEVERILTGSSATVLTLRAAVVLGSGSTSFEIIRQVSERLPVQTVPTWMDSEVQPIAVVDVIEILSRALVAELPSGHYDVGGPDSMPYAELLDLYAEIAGLTRPQVSVPFLPTDLVGRLTGMFTDVPAPTVQALVESLHHDMVAGETRFQQDLLPPGYRLMGLREAIERSLGDTPDSRDAKVAEPDDPASADPMGPMPQDPAWAGGGDDERGVVAKVADRVRDALS